MPSITDAPPPQVQAELLALKDDLNRVIPPRRLEQNLLIATWNLRAFGDLTRKWASTESDNPKRDLHSILCIAEIISRFDVIALQEVKSNIRALRDTLKVLGSHWGLILTDVTQGSAGNEERMAFLFGYPPGAVVRLGVRAGRTEGTSAGHFARCPPGAICPDTLCSRVSQRQKDLYPRHAPHSFRR